DVAVVGGSPGMTGAVLLAARAAHAAGAGRVYVSMLDPAHAALDPLRPELMFRTAWWQSDPATLRHTTVVCGCGAGPAVKGVLPVLLSHVPRLVLDADALNAIADDGNLQRLLLARHSRQLETVLTPHPLEAARLLGTDTSTIQADRIAAAEKLAGRFACVVIVKGSGSVICAPGLAPVVNSNGNAALATAGTGDVLAGWLGGCWSADHMTAHQAALHAVWVHGQAADMEPVPPLRAADLIEVMHRHAGGMC
ncbi:MAG TPA: NAD(P)H-hydrate dehydratase, partial [Rhizobacter sp.]|nr:NAD(P)H-hydrate dehydratase [Rhizobacter sp.]